MEDLKTIKNEVNSAANLSELDSVYKKYLGKKGSVALALREVGNFSEEERKDRAPKLQTLKKEIEQAIFEKSEDLKTSEIEDNLKTERLDISVPGKKVEAGHIHPLTQIQNKANDIFASLGFEVVEGPEVETEWYNFDALNVPGDHPARDMQDTFWLKPESARILLRTQTSPVQVRYMETHQPPLRIVVPGRVFRHEASDASHDIQFYQLEGLMVDKDISVANFKAVINEFLSRMFGDSVKIRLRPSFFPFVEPGFEVDMACTACTKSKIKNQKSKVKCSVCGGSGWLEMLGAGMVHPNVLKAVGLNVKNWQGFAFGVGLDRIAMMKYKIDDIRLFYSGDLRFLKQF